MPEDRMDAKPTLRSMVQDLTERRQKILAQKVQDPRSYIQKATELAAANSEEMVIKAEAASRGEWSVAKRSSGWETPQGVMRQQLIDFLDILDAITPQGELVLTQEQRASFAKLVDQFEQMDADPDFAQRLRHAVGYKVEDNFPAGKVKTALRKIAR